MEFTINNTIGEIVAQDYRLADVFDNHEIDYCCNGDKTLESACREKDLNAETVIGELKERLAQPGGGSVDYNSWSLDFLADYIENTHHRYTESAISEIKPLLEKISMVHGDSHPELFEIKELFYDAAGEFAAHMKKEELMFFPRVRKMMAAKNNGEKFEVRSSAENSIKMLMHEHDNEGEKLHKIKDLSKDYQTPEDGCTTYSITLAKLKEFEEDMHKHIHLENNILFPKALELEKSFE